MTFTPGPWSYNHDTGTIETAKKIVGYNRYATTDAETEANGRLMAAAPGLLAALRGFVEEYYDDPATWPAGVAVLLSEGHAAIAKATGEHP